MSRRIRIALFVGLVIALALPSVAVAAPPVQDDAPPVTITSASQLTDIVDDDQAAFASLSPSGDYLAYYGETGGRRDRVHNICVYTFESASQVCYALPEEFDPYPYDLAWSPDDSLIAFTENPIEFGNESDIWVLAVADGTIQNLTDDGIVGSWRSADTEVQLDYLPFWGPKDGLLYFWRAVPHGDLTFDLGIYSLSSTGEVELVRDVTSEIPSSLPYFKQEEFFLDGPSALSPDGNTVAALMSTMDPMGAVLTSLWLIDISRNAAAPVEAVENSGWSTAVPDWQSWPAAPISLSWTSDSKGVVVLETSPDPHTPFMVFDYIDAATNELTPIVDFSGLADPDAYFDIASESGLPWRVYSPWTATLSPQGDKLLMINDLGGAIGVFSAQLPPDGTLPVLVKSSESTFMSTASRSSRAADGKVLVYGIVATVEE